MDQKPTPDQLERARQISADIVAKVDCPLRDKYLDGRCDHSYAVRAALTAILAADQQQAELLRHAEAMAGALRLIRHQWAGHAEECAYVKSAYKAKCDCDWSMVAERCDTATNAFREWQGGRSDG